MLEKALREFIKENQGNIGVAFKNLDTGEPILINEEMIFPSASLIKLAIMSEVMNRVKKGGMTLEDEIMVEAAMMTGGDGILKELKPGHVFTLEEIITLMIIVSDNLATNILIDKIGMESVNRLCQSLGLGETKLQRKMMDAQARKEGRENYTCAKDMLALLELIYRGDNVDGEYSARMLEILKKQQITGRLQLYLPEEITVAHKTGDLDLLEHDVGIMYLPQCTCILCVLTHRTLSNKEGREIIGKIAKLVYDSYSAP